MVSRQLVQSHHGSALAATGFPPAIHSDNFKDVSFRGGGQGVVLRVSRSAVSMGRASVSAMLANVIGSRFACRLSKIEAT